MADDKLVSRLLLIGLAVVVLAILITQYTKKKNAGSGSGSGSGSGVDSESKHQQQQWSKETFTAASPTRYGAGAPAVPQEQPSARAAAAGAGAGGSNVVVPSEPLSNESYKAVNYDVQQKLPSECVPRDKLTVEDLLPRDAANSKWAQVAPAGQGDVKDQNFLTAGYLIGVNTVGQTMRNANLQIRSDPPIDRMNVGPWNQTTIEYDSSRRMFEIGNC